MIAIRFVLTRRTCLIYQKGSKNNEELLIVFDGEVVAKMDKATIGCLSYILRDCNHGVGIFGDLHDYFGHDSDDSSDDDDDNYELQRPDTFTWSSGTSTFRFSRKNNFYLESTVVVVNGGKKTHHLYYRFLSVVMFFWDHVRKWAVRKMRRIFSAIDDTDVFLGGERKQPRGRRNHIFAAAQKQQETWRRVVDLDTLAFLAFVKYVRSHETLSFKGCLHQSNLPVVIKRRYIDVYNRNILRSWGDCLQLVDCGCVWCDCPNRGVNGGGGGGVNTPVNDVEFDVRLFCRREMFLPDTKIRVETADTSTWWKTPGVHVCTEEDVQCMILQDTKRCKEWLDAKEKYVTETMSLGAEDKQKTDVLDVFFAHTLFGYPSSGTFSVSRPRGKQPAIDVHFPVVSSFSSSSSSSPGEKRSRSSSSDGNCHPQQSKPCGKQQAIDMHFSAFAPTKRTKIC